MTVALDEWLGVMEREYTASFIPEGGGAVRVVVAPPETLDRASGKLRVQATHAGLQVITVDVAQTKLHMLQNLFFAIAAALPWQTMLQTRIETLVTEGGYRWPAPGRSTTLAALAEVNEIAQQLLRRDLAHWLTSTVWRDADMAQDFRSAMIALLSAQVNGESEGGTDRCPDRPAQCAGDADVAVPLGAGVRPGRHARAARHPPPTPGKSRGRLFLLAGGGDGLL